MRFTLVTDGVSDQALIPILVWLARQCGIKVDLQPQWADLRGLKKQPQSFDERVATALRLYECELLFVHRDAEKQDPALRFAEIERAIVYCAAQGIQVPHVCVVPIRMQEAWLLIDEHAIRSAAGNPNGKVKLTLPKLNEMEKIPDPKEYLFNLIRTASQLSARRLRKLPLGHARRLVADYIDDYSPLRAIPAFAVLESELTDVAKAQGWI